MLFTTQAPSQNKLPVHDMKVKIRTYMNTVINDALHICFLKQYFNMVIRDRNINNRGAMILWRLKIDMQ